MKSLILAAGLIAVGATAASAQYGGYGGWQRSQHPYEARHHSVCQSKARELWGYERRATSDGILTRHERTKMARLRNDLDRTCGRFRWRG